MSSVEDELALRGLMDTYIDAVARRDADRWGMTWAEDATWQLMGNEVTGRDNILAMWQGAMSTFEFAIMMPSSAAFQIDGDKATGHWYLQEYTRNTQGENALVLGHYTDQYSKTDGQWYYQRRDYHIIYIGPSDLSGQYTPVS